MFKSYSRLTITADLYLQFFADYGSMAAELCENRVGRPFHKLLFLIGDWGCSHEHPYGFIGGEEYVNMELEVQVNDDIY